MVIPRLDDGGSIFEGAIQTSIVRPEPDSPLSLESPTRDLVVEAGRDIELMSKAGEIQINAIFDINLKAKQGEIRLDSSDIFISGLETSTGLGSAQYQLCVCRNGRLFLATVKADCRADRSICS
uniref:Beta-sarcoglycan n=1 Tax=Globodera pallida TaxID=36090 RepID=A0A183CEX8_GLOPA